MSSVSPLAGSVAPATGGRSTKLQTGYQQRHDDQAHQFRTFLEEYTRDGSPLPSYRGKLAIGVLLKAASLSFHVLYKSPVFNTIAEEYAKKVGITTIAKFRERFSALVPEAVAPVDAMTYQRLLDLDTVALGLTTPKSIASYRSALTRFMVMSGKTSDDQIGAELAGDYKQAVEKFIEKHYHDNLSAGNSAKSYLNKYQQVVVRKQLTDGLPMALSAALAQLIEKSGRNAHELSIAIGQYRSFIRDLILGKRKTASSEILIMLENQLQIEPGTLTNRATHYNPRNSSNFCPTSLFPVELQGRDQSTKNKRATIRKLLPDNFPYLSEEEQGQLLADTVDDILNNRHRSEYGRNLVENRKFQYTLKEDQLTSQLKQELDEYCDFKHTRGSMAKGRKSRDKMWKPGTNGSENRWRMSMYMYLGWCLLPINASDPKMRGAGLQASNLTLGLIVIPELITSYIAFRFARANNNDTKTSTMFLADCRAMLLAGHGWVEGHPQLLKKLPAEFQQVSGTWQERCAAQFSHVSEALQELDPKTRRDSFLLILPLIEMGKPMDLVQEALASNWKELQIKMKRSTMTARQKAVMFRDHVLISMLAALPLRASHWINMTYRTNVRTLSSREDSELRQLENHRWGLYLRAGDFKNYKNKSVFGPNADRDLALPFSDSENAFKDLEPLVDEYMRVHRPQLCKGNGPIFPSNDGNALTDGVLYRIVQGWTKRYLSEHGDHTFGLRIAGVKPFGPHAFRHLMASHILKTTGRYEDAANMLLDSIQMIIDNYGKYMPSDRLQKTFARLEINRADRS